MEAAKDTVNSLINTASKIVYGEDTSTTGTDGANNVKTSSPLDVSGAGSTGNVTGGNEPVSGVTGDGTASKPYDAGNTTGEPTNTTSIPTATSTSTTPSSGPQISSNPDATTGGTTSTVNDVPKSSATATTAQDVGLAPPESGAAPAVKQQGAANPQDEPDAEQARAISNKNEAAEEALEDRKQSVTHVGGASGGQSGPEETGPKPLGGAGGTTTAAEKEKEALGSTSKEPGTGEQYIKSTGVQAEGGDFDASNPGAGREADRLLEEKGVHRDGNNTGEPVEIPGQKAAAQAAASEKPSLSQKIKDKLHIGSKDKP